MSASLSSPPSPVLRPSARSVVCEGELRPNRWGVCGGMECLSEIWRCTNGWVCVCSCLWSVFWLLTCHKLPVLKCCLTGSHKMLVCGVLTHCMGVWPLPCRALWQMQPVIPVLSRLRDYSVGWECIITLMHLKPHSHTDSWEHQSADELYRHSSISLHDRSGRRWPHS